MSHTAHPPRGVAVYLAVVQFFFALGWSAYSLYLPDLLARAGVDRSWAPWVLALDQALFALADLVLGVAVDRARRALRSIGGRLVGVTALSTAAMLLMPVSTRWGAGAFLAATMIWVATSAALRAPLFALLGRYAATSEVPALAGLVLVGMAAANALAPILGLQLKGVDPLLPFAAAGFAILVSAAGLVAAERRLAAAPTVPAAEAGSPLPFASPAALALMAGLLLAVLGFQVHVAVNAANQIKRVADATMLSWLLPVFWGGFSFGFLPAGALGRRLGPASAAGIACAVGALALAVAARAPSTAVLVPAHALAGGAWAIAFANALGLSTLCGRQGAEGRYAGVLFSLLALGSLGRIALNLRGTPPPLIPANDWLPVLAWGGAAGLLILAALHPRLRGEPPGGEGP